MAEGTSYRDVDCSATLELGLCFQGRLRGRGCGIGDQGRWQALVSLATVVGVWSHRGLRVSSGRAAPHLVSQGNEVWQTWLPARTFEKKHEPSCLIFGILTLVTFLEAAQHLVPDCAAILIYTDECKKGSMLVLTCLRLRWLQ